MKIYLAAPYSTKEQMKVYAEQVRELGDIITSSWLEEPHAASTQMHELTHDIHEKYAVADLEDVAKADLVIFFTDPSKTIVRGGRHVEFGYALGLGIPVWVVGDIYENIFHHLPQVRHFESWEKVQKELKFCLDIGIWS